MEKKFVFQILVALAANCGTINTGLVFGYTAVSLPQLKMPTSRIFINRSQASWIGKSYKQTL
jgi:SP family facilitated glucose transporter-like MFS transporter 8